MHHHYLLAFYVPLKRERYALQVSQIFRLDLPGVPEHESRRRENSRIMIAPHHRHLPPLYDLRYLIGEAILEVQISCTDDLVYTTHLAQCGFQRL